MPYNNRTSSVGANTSKNGSIQPLSRDGRENKMPPSVVSTNGVSYVERTSSLKNPAELDKSDTEKLSWCRFLVSPIVVLFIAAYVTLDLSFKLYTYSQVQNNLFPNEQINSSTSCNADKNSTNYMNRIAVQKEASSWNSYFAIAAGVPSIFSSLILGSITDRFGRKFMFVVPCIGILIRGIFTVVGVYFKFKLEYFLIGYFIEGFTGQLYAIVQISFAYISDITPQQGLGRTFAFTILECSYGLCGSLFGFTTGYFVQDTGYFYPMLSSVPMLCLSLFLMIFLPESFPKEKRSTKTGVISKLKTAFNLFFGEINKGRRWIYLVLQTVLILTTFSIFGSLSTDTLYQLNEPFCWTPKKLGYFIALRSGLQHLVGMVLIKVLQTVMSGETIAIIGSISRATEYMMEGLAETDVVLYLVPVVGSIGMLTIPIMRALISKQTKADQQGAVFAASAALEICVHLVAAVVSNTIYANTIEFYRGFVYFVYCIMNLMCVVLVAYYKFKSKQSMPI